MTDYFFDSSALMKRYVTEAGSVWVRNITIPSAGYLILVSQITPIEMVSALSRRKREGTISARTAQAARLLIDRHASREYEITYLVTEVVQRAKDLLENYPLRAFDAVQLASAIEVNKKIVAASQSPLIFVCADARLLNAATNAGLQTHNPT